MQLVCILVKLNLIQTGSQPLWQVEGMIIHTHYKCSDKKPVSCTFCRLPLDVYTDKQEKECKAACSTTITKRWTQKISFFSTMMKDVINTICGWLGLGSCNHTLNTCFCWGVERRHSQGQNWLPPTLRRHYSDLLLLSNLSQLFYA